MMYQVSMQDYHPSTIEALRKRLESFGWEFALDETALITEDADCNAFYNGWIEGWLDRGDFEVERGRSR